MHFLLHCVSFKSWSATVIIIIIIINLLKSCIVAVLPSLVNEGFPPLIHVPSVCVTLIHNQEWGRQERKNSCNRQQVNNNYCWRASFFSLNLSTWTTTHICPHHGWQNESREYTSSAFNPDRREEKLLSPSTWHSINKRRRTFDRKIFFVIFSFYIFIIRGDETGRGGGRQGKGPATILHETTSGTERIISVKLCFFIVFVIFSSVIRDQEGRTGRKDEE